MQISRHVNLVNKSRERNYGGKNIKKKKNNNMYTYTVAYTPNRRPLNFTTVSVQIAVVTLISGVRFFGT